MPAASEIRTVARRGAALAFLERHAELKRCAVAVLDDAGAEISRSPGSAAVRTSGSNGTLRVVDPARCSTSAVRVFDRVVGWVVATSADEDPAADVRAGEVADRGAALLSDLCSREYELNDLSREILGAYEELNLFYELSAELAVAADPESICRTVARQAVRVMGVERAWVLLRETAPRRGLAVAAAENAPAGAGDLGPGEGSAGRVVAAKSPEVFEDASQLAEAALAGWERSARQGLVTVPIVLPGREDAAALGVLQVADRRDGAPFGSGDVKLATALASHAAVLVENQRLIAYERELQIARTIQQNLLPSTSPDVLGLDIAASCVPASDVGGDYYDHLVVSGGRLGVLVADVSGHNLAAALLQTAARSVFRSEALAGGAPSQVLQRANRTLHDDLERSELFLTAWYGTIDAATRRFAVCDAGHPPALVWRRDTGTVEDVAAGGLPFGVDREAAYEETDVVLRPGDVVLVYTDGLTEARASETGEEYGPERLAEVLARSAGLGARAVVDAVLADVAAWDGGGPAADDRSLVVVKVREIDSR